MTNVDIPLFEIVGPPCEVDGCKGVLTDCVDPKTQDFFHRCSVCGAIAHRMTGKEKLAWAVRTIEGALKGERPS